MPLGESMISVVKSNKSIMLDKSRRFRKTLGGYGEKQKTEYSLPDTTPEIIHSIRQKMRNENRKATIKNIIVLCIPAFSIIIIWLLIL